MQINRHEYSVAQLLVDPMPFKDSLPGCVLPSAVFSVVLQLMDWVPLGVGIHLYAPLLVLCEERGLVGSRSML